MKLAEALAERADIQKRLLQLRSRLERSAKIQDGERPDENPDDLLEEMEAMLARFLYLVRQINKTNNLNAGIILDGKNTLYSIADMLAERDTLIKERDLLNALINAAAGQQIRMTRTEIKIVSTINVAAMQKRVDDVSKRHRELDTSIQSTNWLFDLIESGLGN